MQLACLSIGFGRAVLILRPVPGVGWSDAAALAAAFSLALAATPADCRRC